MKNNQLSIRVTDELKELMNIMYGNKKSENIERLVKGEAEKMKKYAIVENISGAEIGDEDSRLDSLEEVEKEIREYILEDLKTNEETEYIIVEYINNQVINKVSAIYIENEIKSKLRNNVKKYYEEVKEFIYKADIFDKLNKKYEFETEFEAEELETMILDLNDNNVTTDLIDNTLEVDYENLDRTGELMKMYYNNFNNANVKELRALYNALDHLCDNDVKHYLKNPEQLQVFDKLSYDENAKDMNKTIEDEEDKMKLFDELEDGFNGSNNETFADKENGYVIEFIY